jgi:hypothetical protein
LNNTAVEMGAALQGLEVIKSIGLGLEGGDWV